MEKGDIYNLICDVFTKYNISHTKKQVEDLCKFVDFLKQYNSTHNLTAITDDREIVYKHLLDSLLPINNIPKGKLLDIGCGGGFPSIPLAIMRPDIEILAIDSVGKKITFVENAIAMLNLRNVLALKARVEDLAQKREFRESFDIVTSRAVAPLNVILEYSAPMLVCGGKIVAYKGSAYSDELDASKNAMKILDCSLESVLKYNITEINAERNVLLITKNSKTPSKYPRSQNKPRLKPL